MILSNRSLAHLVSVVTLILTIYQIRIVVNLSHEMVSIDGVLRPDLVDHPEVDGDGVDGEVVLDRPAADIDLEK